MMVDKLIQPGKSWDFLVVGSSKSKLQPVFYVFFSYSAILKMVVGFIGDTGYSCHFYGATRWCPPVISWFITPIKYRYIYHKPKLLELCSPT